MANVTVSINSKFDSSGTKEAKNEFDGLKDAVDKIRSTFDSVHSTIGKVTSSFNKLKTNTQNLTTSIAGLTVVNIAGTILNKITKAVGEATKSFRNLAGSIETIPDSGVLKAYNTNLENITIKIGEALSAFDTVKMDMLNPVLTEIDTWLSKHRKNILGFITSLPDIASIVLGKIGDNLYKVFTLDFWKDLFLKILSLAGNMAKSLGKLLIAAGSVFIQDLWYRIQHPDEESKMEKQFDDKYYAAQDAFNQRRKFEPDAPEAQHYEEVANLEGGIDLRESYESLLAKYIEEEIQGRQEHDEKMSETFQSALAEFGESAKGLKDGAFDIAKYLGDNLIGEESIKEIMDIIATNIQNIKDAPARTQKDEGVKEGPEFGNFGVDFGIMLGGISEEALKNFNIIENNLNGLLKNVDSNWGNVLKEAIKNIGDFKNNADANIKESLMLIGELNDPERVEEYYNKTQDEINKIIGLTKQLDVLLETANVEAERAQAIQDAGKKITDTAKNSTEIDDVINGAMTAGPMGAIAAIIGQVVGIFSQIENVGKVLNPFSTILERIATILEPLLNEIFAPFVIILESVGDIIGNLLAPIFEFLIALLHPILNVIVTIFDILKPLFTLFNMIASILISTNPLLNLFSMALKIIADIIKLVYNKIFVPVGNGLIFVFTKIENAFVWLYNKISDVLKSITFGIVNLGHKSSASYEDRKLNELSNDPVDYSADYQSNSSSSSGSASYTAVRDITVNIFFNNSFVNGNAEEIAIMLRDEILLAEAKGY